MIQLTPPQIQKSFSFSEAEKEFMKLNHDIKNEDVLSIYKSNPREQYERLVQQIFLRQQAKQKFPSLYQHTDVFYPTSLSVEQSSSEEAAKFKASLFKGKTFIDLTGGMGVDSLYFAKQFQKGIIIEQNIELAKISAHNFALLNQLNVEFGIGLHAEDFVNSTNEKSDLVFIDPARRDKHGGKIVRLEDCEPNIIQLQERVFEFTDHILIKTSPLLDINLACQQLKHVRNVYVVAIENECKELLFHLEKNYIGDYQIHAIHLKVNSVEKFSFWNEGERLAISNLSEVKKYLYEPNAAIMKAGCFKSICDEFDFSKLHMNSHLYTSNQSIENFQGRSFEVLNVLHLDKRKLQELIPEMKANLTIRNFPGSVAELRKKLGLKDGGNTYLFATTDFLNNKILIHTRKMISSN